MVALACQLPAATGVPLSRWTGPELLAELAQAGTGDQLSASSVLRILAEHPVKPWQYQSWICPRAPDFAAKATVILDLYQGFYQGRRLRPGDRIVSVDAKPSIQARGRCRPTAPAARGKPVRAEHEYVRHGALALLAALDVHTGTVFAATPASTGIHASWLNQAEIFFSITQKKVLTPNDFASLEELARTLLAFTDRYNQTARPFNWNSPPLT